MKLALIFGLILGSVRTLASPISCLEALSSLHQTLYLAQVRSQFTPEDFYWNFPSDHLPAVGVASLENTRETFQVVTWNVLNQNYVHHILENSQGLRDSEITSSPDRTSRLMTVLHDLMSDIQPAILALQEVDSNLLLQIQTWSNLNGYQIEVVKNPSGNGAGETIDFGVVIFKPSILHIEPRLSQVRSFLGPSKYIQHLVFRTNRGTTFQFANVHRAYNDHDTLKEYLSTIQLSTPTILAGDLNLDRSKTEAFLGQIDGFLLMKKPNKDFTHVDTHRNLTDYDHILYSRGIHVRSSARLNMKAKRHFRLRSLKAN